MAKNHIFIDTRLQIKRDTSANWEKNNPVLLDGEEILVYTNAGEIRKKVGDGTKTYTQLPFIDEPIRTLIAAKVDKIDGKGLSTNDYTVEEKTKLSGIDYNANNYTHPTYDAKTSGLYKITVDNTGHVSAVTAVNKSDITSLGIPEQDTTYSVATTSANGLMSFEDKVKLIGIEEGANKYVHPTTHPASIIVQDENNRFVTDKEKESWNNKSALTLGETASTAYAGDKGKANADAIVTIQTNLENILTRLSTVETKLQTAIFYG